MHLLFFLPTSVIAFSSFRPSLSTPDDNHGALTFTPHWLSPTTFWYRRRSALRDHHDFIVVDTKTGIQTLAFNHSAVAHALRKRGLHNAHHKALPFQHIEIRDTGVAFQIGEDAFSYTVDGKVVREISMLREPRLAALPNGQVSVNEGEETKMRFVNDGTVTVSLQWIDTEGNAVPYADLAVGQDIVMNTYVGHVWSAFAGSKVIGSWRATGEEGSAYISDGGRIAVVAPANATKTTQDDPNPWAGLASLFGGIAGNAGRAFVKDNNVWMRDGGKEIQLSKTGSIANPFRRIVYHSPDGKYAAVWQVSPEQRHPVTLVESSPRDQLQPKTKVINYLKPGDKVEIERPRIFDLEGKKEIETSDDLFNKPFGITNIGWSSDSKQYRFVYNERGHQKLSVIGMSVSGRVNALIEDSQKTFVDYSSKQYYHSIHGTDQFIWMSERDGYNHLYLFDLANGTLRNQITKGEYVVRTVEKVDDKARQIWFKGYGLVNEEDWYHAHMARINFDGSGLTVLTQGDGTHSWRWSPDRSTFTDTYSRVDAAPNVIVRDGATGKEVSVVSNGDTKAALRGTEAPERFVTVGRDGKTKIYGIIIKPKSFDPAKKYPILEQIYAGPQDFFVPKAFGTFTRQREWADAGFILVQIDGMGTNWRNKEFHDICAKNLKDGGFVDRIAWMKEAAKTRPWMDLENVGIYGGSAGGQNAMAAVLFHGDFYKAAAADSGCHDNRMDKIWWNEQWMGYPIDKSYEDSSNTVHAGKLTGALMLIVGELDTNVDPSSTYQVVNALNKAGKDYELLLVPGGQHGTGSSAYGRRRQLDFFRLHLKGEKAPNRNAKG